MEAMTVRDVKAVFARLNDLMTENKQYLIELDGVVGDGDLGLTMHQGFQKAHENVQAMSETDVGTVMAKAGMVIARHAPSTMGTLMGTGFMKGGKAIQGHETMDVEQLSVFFAAFLDGIMARGKSEPGEKTVVDALHPAVESLKDSLVQNRSLTEALNAAYEASVQGVEATKEMVAQRGRAAYYGEGSKGKQDPGATVGMLLFKGFAGL